MTRRERNLYRAALSWGLVPMPGDDEGKLVKLDNGLVAFSVKGTDSMVGGEPQRPTGVKRVEGELKRWP